MVRGLLTKKQHVWLVVWNWIVILGDKNEYLGDNIVLVFFFWPYKNVSSCIE